MKLKRILLRALLACSTPLVLPFTTNISASMETTAGTVQLSTVGFDVDTQGGYLYVISQARSGKNLTIINNTDPSNPTEIGSTLVGGFPYSIDVNGNFAYVGTDKGLIIVNITNPSSPRPIRNINPETKVTALEVSNNRLYTINKDESNRLFLQIFSLATPSTPSLKGKVQVGAGTSYDVKVANSKAFVVLQENAKLVSVDLTSETTPSVISKFTLSGIEPTHVDVRDTVAYVSLTNSDAIEVIDISNPTNIQSISTIATGDNPRDVKVYGDNLFVTNVLSNNVEVFNISTPANPDLIDTFVSLNQPRRITFSGAYASILSFTPNSTITNVELGTLFDIDNLPCQTIFSTSRVPNEYDSYSLVKAGQFSKITLKAHSNNNTTSLTFKGRVMDITNTPSNTCVVAIRNNNGIKKEIVEGGKVTKNGYELGTFLGIDSQGLAVFAVPAEALKM